MSMEGLVVAKEVEQKKYKNMMMQQWVNDAEKNKQKRMNQRAKELKDDLARLEMEKQ